MPRTPWFLAGRRAGHRNLLGTEEGPGAGRDTFPARPRTLRRLLAPLLLAGEVAARHTTLDEVSLGQRGDRPSADEILDVARARLVVGGGRADRSPHDLLRRSLVLRQPQALEAGEVGAPVGRERLGAGLELGGPLVDVTVDVRLLGGIALRVRRRDPHRGRVDLRRLMTCVPDSGRQLEERLRAAGGERRGCVAEIAPLLVLIDGTPLVPPRVLLGV